MSGLAVLLSLAACPIPDPVPVTLGTATQTPPPPSALTLAGWPPPARAPSVSACPAPAPHPGPAASTVPWATERYPFGALKKLADGHGIVVAVVDSGVDARNPQLRGAVQPGPDQLDGGPSVLDCVGHGTGVAGIIAARPLPGTTFQGLAPAATILALRVSELTEGENGTTTGRRGTSAGLATAIRDAVSRGARVINLSLVSYRDDEPVRAAVRYAQDHDVLLVAAAGNAAEQGNTTPYPAAYDGVVGVGAITPDGKRAPTSQTGPYVDLVAPGTQIVTTAPLDGLTVMEGTSFATPFVSATAALIRQYRPDLTAAQVAAQLTSTADGGQAGPGYGAGVLNPLRALTERLGATPRSQPPLPQHPAADTAEAARAAQARWQTAGLALFGLLLAALVGAAALILPMGHRRRWRSTLRPLPTGREMRSETPTPD